MPFPSPQASSFRFLGAGAALSLILLTFLLFGRSSHFGLGGEDSAAGYVLKSSSCSDVPHAQPETDVEFSADSQAGGEEWVFDVQRDGDNHGLSGEQCLAAFPKLFGEIDSVAEARKEKPITFREVDELAIKGGADENGNGIVRAMILDGELYLIQYGPMPYTFSRGKATLHSLHRALAAYPDRKNLPNIEFVFTTDDFSTGQSPVWSYSKQATEEDKGVWLMPDFGYWSWPEVKVGSYKEVRRRIAEVDDGSFSPSSNNGRPENGLKFHDKKKQLLWRGSVTANPEIRGALLRASRGKSWASMREIVWANPAPNILPMEDHCQYMFLAHTEGRSFSGRGKYLLNCRSVVISHKLQWIEAHHGALISSGPDANYVEVNRDFSDLEHKLEFLLDNPEAAERIAENAVRTFRDRYLTPAAESCYWRHLVRRYGEVSAFEPVLYEKSGKEWVKRGVHFESWVLEV
ncbi:glycosyl transferase family 90-domain-containing protein [Aspergillus unguis]